MQFMCLFVEYYFVYKGGLFIFILSFELFLEKVIVWK